MTRDFRSRFLPTTTLAALLGTCAGLGAVVLDAPAGLDGVFVPSARADETDVAVKALLDAAKGKDGEAEALKQLIALQDNQAAAVTDAFVELTKSKHEKLAVQAIVQAAKRHDAGFQKIVKSKIADKKLPKDKPELFKAYLEAAREYRDPKMADALEKTVNKYLPTEPAFSTRAIKAYGSVPTGEVVEQLIKWLQQTESTGGGGGGAAKMSTEQRDAYSAAKGAVVETLADLTGVDIGNGTKWREFWDEKAKGFKFPDPDAPPTDWASLREWSDVGYGYTVTLPAGPAWKFVEPDNGDLRARIKMDDGDGTNWGRCDIWQTNLSNSKYSTLKDNVEYFRKQFVEERFTAIKGDAPAVETRKIAGREFTLLTAIGENKGTWGSWGSTETRLYFTQVDNILLFFEITVRLGAEPDVKADFFDIAEKSVWQ